MVKFRIPVIIEEEPENPTSLTEHFLNIMKNVIVAYKEQFSQKDFKKFIFLVKLRVKYLQKYQEIFEISQKTSLASGIKELEQQFVELSKNVALNNVILTYAHQVEKETFSDIITVEDRKHQAFAYLASKKISLEHFKHQFGHHALNPFELSEKRFSEYSQKELLKIASFMDGFVLEKKTPLREAIEHPNQLFPVYAALREELRDKLLLILAEIRKECLSLQKKHSIEDIFSKSYDEVLHL
jgi:hypothetical protein